MEELRDGLEKLVQKTLTMEDPRLTFSQTLDFSQSQEMYESDNNSEEIKQEPAPTVEKQPEKKQDLSQPQSKILNRHKLRYTTTKVKYSPTRIKFRNFLSNISYTGINKNDFYNENFILDIYVLLVKNLKPFSLTKKDSDKTKHEMVYMLWRECIPSNFYRYVCDEKNFLYLNGRDVGHADVLEIVGNFIDQGKQNLRMLQENLTPYKDTVQ